MELTLKELNKFLKNPFSSNQLKVEKKIHSLLKKKLSPEEVFKKLSGHNVKELSRFLYNSGMESALLKYSISQLKKNKPVSWPFILKILIKSNITPDKKLEKILFKHWLSKKENQTLSLFACEQWGDLSPEFQQLMQVYIQDMEEKNLSKEKELLDQLLFVQAQDLVSEEEEIISKLLAINPENKDYIKLKKELVEKKALFIIQKERKHRKEKTNLEKSYNELYIDDINKDWLNEIFKIAKKNKSHTKNLALFLYFCNNPSHCIKLLDRHIDKVSDYWFYLDWCIQTKQFTKGLELINQLSLKANKQLSILPLIYIKAQILYALGKKNIAIEYLQSIYQFNPDYKSVEYLLNKWS
ncbi:MAG: hypothetical protein OXC37_06090 [Bdellovibrionaceae bacterium]|nr:hypothetical protein [Pseudobdellovibrionaceae bacterium]